jgi:hypothetical protein
MLRTSSNAEAAGLPEELIEDTEGRVLILKPPQ